MTKKILITGAAGFIGSHLVERLFKDGYDLKLLLPYNVDMRDAEGEENAVQVPFETQI